MAHDERTYERTNVDTCGGLGKDWPYKVPFVEAIERDLVQGTGQQLCEHLAGLAARHRDVAHLLAVLRLDLDQKVLKGAALRHPGHQEAVPRHLGHCHTAHLGLQILWG